MRGRPHSMETKRPPMTRVTQDDLNHMWRVLLNREHRVLVSVAHKVAITEWIRLFLRMDGFAEWKTANVHYLPRLPAFCHLGTDEAQQIITSDDWTKIIVFRDPAERLLSAYLDRVGPEKRSFGEFIDSIEDIDSCDMHWVSQWTWNRNSKFFAHYDHCIDLANSYSEARRVLSPTGCWERYCTSGWGLNGKLEFMQDSGDHPTFAKTKLNFFYTPELLARVKSLYAQDYAMIDALRSRDADGR